MIGLYTTDDVVFSMLIRGFNPSIGKKVIEEVIDVLRIKAKKKDRTKNMDLIAVNNGIFDYKEKVLLPFSPKYIFLAKSSTDYKENAKNPILYHEKDDYTWDIESWLLDI